MLLLELTRAYNWRQDWYETKNAFKIQKYKRLQARMLTMLPRGWEVEVILLTVGIVIRGSFHEPCWLEILHRFGISSQRPQSRFLQELTRQALEELD